MNQVTNKMSFSIRTMFFVLTAIGIVLAVIPYLGYDASGILGGYIVFYLVLIPVYLFANRKNTIGELRNQWNEIEFDELKTNSDSSLAE